MIHHVMNRPKGGYNCTCNEGFSGKGVDTEGTEDNVLVGKPGCIKDGPGTRHKPFFKFRDQRTHIDRSQTG